MISSKKLIKIAGKWQKLAALKRKSIVMPPFAADKGHFVIYTVDQKRFMVPLEYLGDNIFSELLKMSEEQFGFPADGPITIPFESQIMEYILPLIARGASRDLEKVLLSSVASLSCSESSVSYKGQEMQQLIICNC